MTGTLPSVNELRARVSTQLLDIGFILGGLDYDELLALQACLRRHAQKPSAAEKLHRQVEYGQARVKVMRQIRESPLVMHIAERDTDPYRLSIEDLNLILDHTPQADWQFIPAICGVGFKLDSTPLQLGTQLGLPATQAHRLRCRFTDEIDDLVYYRSGQYEFYTLDSRVRLLLENSRINNLDSLRRRMSGSTNGNLHIRGLGPLRIRVLKRWLIDNDHADLATRLRDRPAH